MSSIITTEISTGSNQVEGPNVCHRLLCGCLNPGRRLFTGALLSSPLWFGLEVRAQGVEVGDRSVATKLVPAEQLEAAAASQYSQIMRQAAQKNALAPPDHPQVRRLRFICQRLVRFVGAPNLRSTPRAAQWQWEVNLIASEQINAFCMPGGKIAFYTGILEKLQLNDDEVAQIMGHEIAHALREHARERVGKSLATRGALELGSALLGLGNFGRAAADAGAQLLSLKFGRDDESEADKIGMDLAARSGYDPAAGVSLWEKMGRASKGAPPQWLSTHPSGDSRIRDMQANLPAVQPLFVKAPRPSEVFGPPARR